MTAVGSGGGVCGLGEDGLGGSLCNGVELPGAVGIVGTCDECGDFAVGCILSGCVGVARDESCFEAWDVLGEFLQTACDKEE